MHTQQFTNEKKSRVHKITSLQ